LEISNLSIGYFRIAFNGVLLDNSNMSKSLKEVVEARLDEINRNPFEAAESVGLQRNFIDDLLNGKKGSVRGANLEKLAGALSWTPAQLSAALGWGAPGRTVQIVGKAGAGPDGSVVFSEGDGALGEAPAPPGATPSTVALEVSGTSMRGIAEDGWLIYYDERRSPLTNDMLGELCILELESGQVLVKTPYPSREEGYFDLESTNAPTMRAQAVKWGALVTAIVPRRAARKVLARTPPSVPRRLDRRSRR
jgi:hypothetical protein